MLSRTNPTHKGACMPQYLSPGVYVEEVDSGARPIEGVGTAVAAFVGIAEKGPVNEPTLVTNWSQFAQTFGEFVEGAYLPHAVFGYFLNGGGSAYIVRVGANGDGPVGAMAELTSGGDGKLGSYRVSALEGGAAGNDISVEVTDAKPTEGETPDADLFTIVVRRGNRVEETFENLSTKRGKQNAATVAKSLAGKVAATKHDLAAGVLKEINSIIGFVSKLPDNPSPEDIDKITASIQGHTAIAEAEAAPAHFAGKVDIKSPLLDALKGLKV